MWLVAVGWLYVVVMMALAEAMGSNGNVLGALITLLFYGLLPLGIVLYILGTPARKRRLQREAEASAAVPHSETPQPAASVTDTLPDDGGHAPGTSQPSSVPAVREKQ